MEITTDQVNNNKEEIAKLTSEERYEITKRLEGKCCTNCTNGMCPVSTREKTGCDERGLPQGTGCYGWENNYIVGRSKILGKTKTYELY